MPWIAREMFRKVASGASPAANEAAEKMPSPIANTALRPRRSASDPAVRTTAASDSVYASITHWTSVKLADRSFSIEGSAVFTTVMSSSNMKVPTLTASKVHHFLDIRYLRTRVYRVSLLDLSGNLVRLPNCLATLSGVLTKCQLTTTHLVRR